MTSFGVVLPTALPAARGWELDTWQTIRVTTEPAAGGRASAAAEQLPGDVMWLIDHAVIQSTSTTGTTLRLYDGAEDRLALLDGSNSGNFDVADWPAGLVLRAGGTLLAVWSGMTTGAVGTLLLQVRAMRRR